ncbi:MAG: hypothetical protein A3E80_05565 [Chlamydiae bacterium RIFCSPHIGHO2_12_FULL_49_9]|nr:MAG: hypothetical protein A3E80_05565 [Chlamydiae bacterium RIFCSPHIGHO2_12_FULL_49_9]
MKFFLIIFTCSAFLHADWDPEYCFPDEDLSLLDDMIFKRLKDDMAYYLRDSWCTKEKIHLLMDLVYVTRPETCVEIGAFSGSSILPVAATLKYLQHGFVDAIDVWSNAEAVRNMEAGDLNRNWWSWVNMEEVYGTFLARLAERSLTEYVRILRGTSEAIAPLIGEIDFLHLDGDYSEKGSLRDVELYLPKVRPGGYILLSNLFVMVNGKAPKMKSFSALFDSCEMICEIDKDNVVLFRKNS